MKLGKYDVSILINKERIICFGGLMSKNKLVKLLMSEVDWEKTSKIIVEPERVTITEVMMYE